jgi:hypothetical protein
MSNEKDEAIGVIEEKDGSVTVELPDSIPSPDQDENLSEGGEASDSAGDEDQPDDTEAVREARRNRRRAKKEYIKRTNVEKDHRLTLLQRQNQELMERLTAVERKTHGADLARFEKAIEDEELRLNYFKAKMREATDNSDGESFTKAQEAWYDSRRKVESMRNFKEQNAEASSRETGAVNPKLQRLANQWMERNSWYDPNSGDEDSAIAKIVDERLIKEGYNPESEEYWDELDNRLQKRLPNRYNQSHDESSRRRPRSVVTGSGRESVDRQGGGNTFVLTPQQVRTMKEAGMWDNLESRNRMIKRYAEFARNNRS